MLVSTTLKYARVLLESGWCQQAEAWDESGMAVEPWDLAAVCWSLPGAVLAVAHDAGSDFDETVELASMALALALKFPPESLQGWNDLPERTKREVLAACDRAIALVPDLVASHIRSAGRELD